MNLLTDPCDMFDNESINIVDFKIPESNCGDVNNEIYDDIFIPLKKIFVKVEYVHELEDMGETYSDIISINVRSLFVTSAILGSSDIEYCAYNLFRAGKAVIKEFDKSYIKLSRMMVDPAAEINMLVDKEYKRLNFDSKINISNILSMNLCVLLQSPMEWNVVQFLISIKPQCRTIYISNTFHSTTRIYEDGNSRTKNTVVLIFYKKTIYIQNII
jgi:hypothetical protein